MENQLRKQLLAGHRLLGTFFELGAPTAAEALALSGLDYIIIDTEHGSADPALALECIRAAKLYHTTPLARVQAISRDAILRLLDAGAMGLIIPSVRTAEEARQIVEYGKYAPLGKRGVSASAGTGFWMEPYACNGLPALFETANRETMLIPQCETAQCLADLAAIVSTPGIDGIFVGPFDLSCAMGIPGEFEKPEFQAALRRIPAVCHAAGKPAFIFAADMAHARAYLEMGYDSLTYGLDAVVLAHAYQNIRAELL